jgi:DNA recombination protein RmuC
MSPVLLILLSIGGAALSAGLVVFFLNAKRKPEADTQTPLILQQVDTLREQVSRSLNQNAELLQKQLETVNLSLRSSSGDINQRLDNAARLYAGLQAQLGQLSQANQQIQVLMKDVSSLQDILRPPKLRGGMGEVLLENLLREILPPEHFTIQHRFSGGQIVDAAIRFRDGIISVDAKFPLENFRRMLEAPDDASRIAARKDFGRNIKKHIDDIHEKYIRTDEGTLPFAFMYIPAENVYYETIIRGEEEGEKALYAYATTRHVMPVSPNSFYAYLITLAQGFRGMKIEERAREIVEHLNRLQLELGKFTEDFRKIGAHLGNAQGKYAEAEKRLARFEDKLLIAGTAPEAELLPVKTDL